jgi:hypothetical protein
MAKMKAPTKIDSAFCETSSAITSGNARSVADCPVDAYAATIDATAKVATPSMLAAITLSRSTIEPCAISGTFQSIGMLSTRCASATPATDKTQAIMGLTHSRSRKRFIRNCIRADRIMVVSQLL